MPVMSAIYCNFANPIISDAVNVPHVSVEINKRFYYFYYYHYIPLLSSLSSPPLYLTHGEVQVLFITQE